MALPASPAPSSFASASTYRSLEGLLRERKLDRTLTSTFPDRLAPEGVAPFGLATLDARILGGLPRGHVSELIGAVSSGRTSLAWTWLGAATARGESTALVDSFDRFDPVSGAACGIDLERLLWVRGQAITKTAGAVDPAWLPGARAVEGPGTLLERTIDRSLKSLNLVLQSHVCTAVVLDFADVPLAGLRRVPLTTWMRLQRIVEGTDIACLLMGPVPLTRSAGGITIAMGASGATVTRGGAIGRAERTIDQGDGPRIERSTVGDQVMYRPAERPVASQRPRDGRTAVSERVEQARVERPVLSERSVQTGVGRWAGDHDRSRRLAGLSTTIRVSSPRQTVQGTVAIDTTCTSESCDLAIL